MENKIHKVGISLIPTEDPTRVYTYGSLPHYRPHLEPPFNGIVMEDINQHVHITVPQEVETIKKGDWFMNCNNYPQLANENNVTALRDDEYKIIATTDPKIAWDGVDIKGYKGSLMGKSLIVLQLPYHKGGGAYVLVSKISHLNPGFLKAYVDNPESEWGIEYHVNKENRDRILKMNPDRSVLINRINKIEGS